MSQTRETNNQQTPSEQNNNTQDFTKYMLKRLVAWILTNSYGRHNTKYYADEVARLCKFVNVILNEGLHVIFVLYRLCRQNEEETLDQRVLRYIMWCYADFFDKESEFYDWKFEYSEEFDEAFAAKNFTKRPLFFAENKETNELVHYGI